MKATQEGDHEALSISCPLPSLASVGAPSSGLWLYKRPKEEIPFETPQTTA